MIQGMTCYTKIHLKKKSTEHLQNSKSYPLDVMGNISRVVFLALGAEHVLDSNLFICSSKL
uniref:Uncharacterized protein n=1 Tax=Romanomermis culicivorax TaxID=13658 RepID=A0A915HT38_ROMCU